MLKKKKFAWLLTAPAIIILFSLGVMPLVWMIWTSLYSFSLNPTLPPEYIGLDNFSLLFEDPQFVKAVVSTIWVLVISLLLELILGFILAMALFYINRFRAIIISLLLIPTAIAPIVAGIVWWMLFNTRFGAINSILYNYSNLMEIPWTIEMPYAFIAIIMAVVWQWTPFVAVIFLGGMTTIPQDILDAALIDSASPFKKIRYIILPLMKPFFVVVGLLMIVETVRLYELPFYITQGGPGNETVVSGIYLFKLAFNFFDLGRASAMSILMVIALSSIALIYLKILYRKEKATKNV